MSAILIAVITVVAISIALYPLFDLERPPARAGIAINPDVENLLSAREATYSAIKDLQTDHAMGKLSDTDYTSLRAKYEGKAMAILQQLDAVQPTVQPATPLLAQGSCPHCGTPIPAGGKFCRTCGTRLGSMCASCGSPLSADSKFCRRCGSPVAALQAA